MGNEMRKLIEREEKISNEVDEVIISTCKKIKEDDFIQDCYSDMVKALAALVEARAALH